MSNDEDVSAISALLEFASQPTPQLPSHSTSPQPSLLSTASSPFQFVSSTFPPSEKVKRKRKVIPGTSVFNIESTKHSSTFSAASSITDELNQFVTESNSVATESPLPAEPIERAASTASKISSRGRPRGSRGTGRGRGSTRPRTITGDSLLSNPILSSSIHKSSKSKKSLNDGSDFLALGDMDTEFISGGPFVGNNADVFPTPPMPLQQSTRKIKPPEFEMSPNAASKFSQLPLFTPIMLPKTVPSNYLKSGLSNLYADPSVKNKTSKSNADVIAEKKHTGVTDRIQYFAENVLPIPHKLYSDIIVIHPGSRNLRIGLASDTFPKEVSHVVVRKIGATTNNTTTTISTSSFRPESLEPLSTEIENTMKAQKLRILQNSASMVTSHNSQVSAEAMAELNDSLRIDWTKVDENTEYITGKKALLVPSLSMPVPTTSLAASEKFGSHAFQNKSTTNDSQARFKSFWPIKHGVLNVDDYTSIRACMADIECIWTNALETELGIRKDQYDEYRVVLVVPDLFNRRTVKELVDMLMREMRFGGIILLQESVCANFGSGLSSACVVDIGAQTISISCVEEGICLADTRINLVYGGDDVTKLFSSILLESECPYDEMQVEQRQSDWNLVEDMKEKFCTLNLANISLEVYNFSVRSPNYPTLKYEMKLYDEVMVAPMGLFHPHIFDIKNKLQKFFKRTTFLDLEETDNTELLWDSLIPETDVKRFTSTTTQLLLAAAQGGDINAARTVCTQSGMMPIALRFSEPKPIQPPTRFEIPFGTFAPIVTYSHLYRAAQKLLNEAPDVSVTEMNVLNNISMPLDHAIALSLARFAQLVSYDSDDKEADERMRRMLLSVLLVGGGSKFNGLSAFLRERLDDKVRQYVLMPSVQRKWMRSQFVAMTTSVANNSSSDTNVEAEMLVVADATPLPMSQIITSPRELDPKMLVWKGASVYVKLESANEMWVGRDEWCLGGIEKSFQKMMGRWK
ncbi:actin-like protein arp8 [Nowakowskiella sp. JEL0407]|nr:actin-like protein arp8 [Nowakowskiella sp. JEL0407]